ncbi:hypothetical protein [Methylobacterium haplocladii]|uniref:Uncharacterized protein n=1 Tax=Methylobacterium haplocladii TaxID=1176176 RepID=A0A512ISG9_9HYPH|nr:hypothetical protein [Methylobacterium haplocladii]GEP00589.1 hypothetical protein MHA02_29760 [Methylobacterium haplocladii]GJD85504.1 hypothetical protein HPGCJGGD_3393 [Methylobacterium haplocladii]GLS57737.1 hypothetical protein GCM10007887_03930 [Methylobacterium haplocladii]
MTRCYAADTSVPMDRSISEIRTTVRRYGATEFAHMESDDQAAITFTMKGRRILFRLAMPDRKSREFTHTEAKRQARSATAAEAAWEQACRSRWRALALVIKAKLEAVEVGIVVFEDEFLANTVPPGASVTFGETVRESMRIAHETRELTPLLPHIRGGDPRG